MLLFSKRAKYIIYTFVIKVLNKKKNGIGGNKGIQFTKSAMITNKKTGLLTSFVNPQTFTRYK